MKISKIIELQVEIIINENLYKKNIIDEETYAQANEILLKKCDKYCNN